MARENQGLQIALIIFVMLTLVLGVTTFIFFRKYEEAEMKAKAAQSEADKQRGVANAVQAENNDLKGFIGLPTTAKQDEVKALFGKDMETYAGNFPQDNRFYSPVLAYLHKVIEDKNIELTSGKTEIQTLKDKIETLDGTKKPQVEQFAAAAARAEKDKENVLATARAERSRIVDDQTKIQGQLEKSRKEADNALEAVQTRLDDSVVRMQKLATLNKQKNDKIEAILKDTSENPDGEIRWVNQANGTVWINLGRADALGRQVTFSVYAPNAATLSKEAKKASIEVTQILGEHLAEARVIEDKISDPIMPGDKIHTPVWSPGEQKRFALAGFIDIDGDGRSDQDTVRKLITMNGGVVDCETDSKGSRHGQMSINTRYLVLGEAPDPKGQKDMKDAIDAYTRMISDAERLGVKKIPVSDLLQQMGWKNTMPVTRFGPGGSPAESRAKPAEGVPKTSSGNVADIFKPRRPPAGDKPAPRSAY